VRPDDVHAARTIAAGRGRAKDSSVALAALVADPARSAIVRATALTLLRSDDDVAARNAAAGALRDPEALVRGTAIENVAAQATTPADFEKIVPLLGDPSRWVRAEAARVLSGIGPQRFADPDAADTRRFNDALAEYRLGQEASADQPAAHMNLGVLQQNQGDAAGAREEYATALRIDPSFVPARFNLAMLEALAGRRDEAEAGFREVIRVAPDFAEARYSLGLLLAEDPARLGEAGPVLREAARAAPGNARMQYNAGLALQHLGGDEAEAFLRAAVNLSPDDPEFRNALTILYVQQGRWEEALPQARRLAELAPGDPRARALVAQVEQRAGGQP
jgi:tetratricopeptide (TPR) repeat protein